MNHSVFTGAGVALITPFTENGVDYQKLDELIEFQIAGGTDSIIITGTTGEASVMTDEEQIEVIKHTVEVVNHRIPVIAGCGSNDTKHGIQLSTMAEAVGADGLLSVTPYYNKTTQKGLVEHYVALARAVSVPVILYNVPGRTGLNMAPATVAKVMDRCDNVVGVKECHFDQVAEIFNLCGPDVKVYSGEDGLVVPMMSMGGSGVISVLANVAPKKVSEMVHACLDGDFKKAAAIQIEAIPMVKALFCETSPIPVKAALNMMGWNVGECRMPLTSMEGSNRLVLEAAMKEYGLI